MWLSVWALTRTKPGVQKQPANTLRVAVFLILEDLTGYNFLHHLEERKKNVKEKKNTVGLLFFEKAVFPLYSLHLFLPLGLDSPAILHDHVSHVQHPEVLRGL